MKRMDNNFIFDQWISENGFHELEHIFVHHQMCTVEHLTLHNPRFPSLLSDARKLNLNHDATAHDPSITSRITESIIALQRWYQEGMEKNVLYRLTSYIEKLEGLQNLSNVINQKYTLKKERNQSKISHYVGICEENLNRKQEEIKETFADLRAMLDAKEMALLQKMEFYRKQYRRFGVLHHRETRELDQRLNDMDGTIAEYIANLKQRDAYCKEKMDECNTHLSERIRNPDRDEEFTKIAEYAMVCYDDAAQILNSQKGALSEYMRRKIIFDIDKKQLSRDNVFFIKQNVEAYHAIKRNIPDFIDIGCVTEKHPVKNVKSEKALE